MNDAAEVDEFLAWYGVAPETIIAVPLHDEEDSSDDVVQLRTAAQAFTQSLDLFGKPSKQLYADLGAFASDGDERRQLEHIGSADGKAEFNARAAESVRIVDVLREFPSARPSIEQLAAMLPPIKMRHYSIASSQRMHPTQVHLLVVVHDWVSNNVSQGDT